MSMFKGLHPVVLAILAMGPVALLLALYVLRQLMKEHRVFKLFRRDLQVLQKTVKMLVPSEASDQAGTGKNSDDPQEIEPDDDGMFAKMKAWYGKLPTLFKGLVWLVAVLLLVVLGNKLKFGSDGERSVTSDDDDSAEVAKAPAKTAKVAKAPAAAPQVNQCAMCKPQNLQISGMTEKDEYKYSGTCGGDGCPATCTLEVCVAASVENAATTCKCK